MSSMMYRVQSISLLLGLASFCCMLSSAQMHTENYITADTTIGTLRGKQFFIENSLVDGFFGVQYAEAPTDSNRWRRPRPKRRWDGTKDALSSAPSCPQLDRRSGSLVGREDCLYMDIVVGGPEERVPRLKPVLVFINNENHYQNGICHTGTILAKREDIAVVIVNSRLGALGYLYDGPDTGNMGLWDNILALQYLHDNLRVFGGDPDKVTIMGCDSGATIAQLLAASPITEGLFHQVVAMSPLNNNMAGLSQEDPREALRELADCNDKEKGTCDIRDLEVEDIVQKINNSRPNIRDPELFPDGFQLNRLQNYNYLTGAASNDELILSHKIIKETSPDGRIQQESMDDILALACSAMFGEGTAQCLCETLLKKRYYLEHYAPYSPRQVNTIISALYHSEFISALDLQSLTKNASTFAYLIDVSEDSKLIGISDRATPTDGSDKSIMTKMVFGYPYITYGGKLGILNGHFHGDDLFCGDDLEVMSGGRVDMRAQSQDVMRYWANFVKNGHPSKGLKTDVHWPTYDRYRYRSTFVTFRSGRSWPGLIRMFPLQGDYVYFNDVFHKAMSCNAERKEDDENLFGIAESTTDEMTTEQSKEVLSVLPTSPGPGTVGNESTTIDDIFIETTASSAEAAPTTDMPAASITTTQSTRISSTIAPTATTMKNPTTTQKTLAAATTTPSTELPSTTMPTTTAQTTTEIITMGLTASPTSASSTSTQATATQTTTTFSTTSTPSMMSTTTEPTPTTTRPPTTTPTTTTSPTTPTTTTPSTTTPTTTPTTEAPTTTISTTATPTTTSPSTTSPTTTTPTRTPTTEIPTTEAPTTTKPTTTTSTTTTPSTTSPTTTTPTTTATPTTTPTTEAPTTEAPTTTKPTTTTSTTTTPSTTSTITTTPTTTATPTTTPTSKRPLTTTPTTITPTTTTETPTTTTQSSETPTTQTLSSIIPTTTTLTTKTSTTEPIPSTIPSTTTPTTTTSTTSTTTPTTKTPTTTTPATSSPTSTTTTTTTPTTTQTTTMPTSTMPTSTIEVDVTKLSIPDAAEARSLLRAMLQLGGSNDDFLERLA